MREVASTTAVQNPNRASDVRLREAQSKLADTLLRTQGKNVVQLFQSLLNDPFGGEGDWDAISGEHAQQISLLHKAVILFEKKVEQYSNLRNVNNTKSIRNCANCALIACDSVAELFQKVLKKCAEEQITSSTESSSFAEEVQRSMAMAGISQGDEDDDEPFEQLTSENGDSSPFPKGVTVEDFEASVKGAQSFIKSFGFTLLHLTETNERAAEQFELRTVISRTLYPDFVGNVEVPRNEVVLNVKLGSVRDISVLAQGIINTAACAIEDDLATRATSQRMSGRGPDYDVSTQLSELLLKRALEIKPNGEVIFTLFGIPPRYFKGEINDNFQRSFNALDEVYRARKEFILESEENSYEGTLSIKFNRGGVLPATSSGAPEEINLSGLKAATVPLDGPEEGIVYLPWSRPLGGAKVLVNAPATFWNNRGTSNIIGSVCTAADLIFNTSKPLVDISIRAFGDSTHEDFVKGKFIFSLLGETIPYEDNATPILNSPVAPRFKPGASYFTFPPHIINSTSIIESSNTILRSAKGFCISLANPDFLPPNTPTANTRCADVLTLGTKLLEGKKDNFLRIKLLPSSDPVSCRFAIQLFSAEGREQRRYYLLENGTIKSVSLDPGIREHAIRNMLRALKQSNEYATVHDVLVEFTKCRIGLTDTFAEKLLGVARSSDDLNILKEFLIDYLLDPLTLIQKDKVQSTEPFFIVGRSGETTFYTRPAFLE